MIEVFLAHFTTIYPGWYPGRAVHIHLRVHVDGTTTLTSQLFFDDAYTETVQAEEAYASNGLPDTTNATDGIAGDPTASGTLLVTNSGETAAGPGTVGLLRVGIG